MSEGIAIRIQAIDQFSEVFDELSGCMSRVEGAAQGLAGSTESLGQRVKASLGLQEKGFKDLAVGLAGAASAGMGFAGIMGQVEDIQLAVARASNRVEDANLGVIRAQRSLNEALEKYGVGSAEAEEKALALQAAQSQLAIAEEALRNAHQGQIASMTQMATQQLPMMAVGMATLYASMGPIGLAIAGVTLAVQLFAKAWSENWLGIRDMLGPVIDSIIGTIQGLIKWLQDAVDWWSKLLGLQEKPAAKEVAAEVETAGAGMAAAGEEYGITYAGAGPGIPEAQAGGFVRRGGLAYLHAGESVVPAGGQTVTVNLSVGQVNSPADEERLARRVADEVAFQLYRRHTRL